MSVTYNPRRTAWDVTWNSASLGLNMGVDIDLKLEMSPIKRAQTGKIVLGHFIDGLSGTIKVRCADVALALLTTICPWLDGGVATLTPITPSTNLYSLAQVLNLHPHDKPSDATEDLNLVKTVPISTVKLDRDGEKDDIYEVEFLVYPDVSELQGATPKLVYGYIGSSAPT